MVPRFPTPYDTAARPSLGCFLCLVHAHHVGWGSANLVSRIRSRDAQPRPSDKAIKITRGSDVEPNPQAGRAGPWLLPGSERQ